MRIGIYLSLAIIVGLFFLLDWTVLQGLLPLIEKGNWSQTGQQYYRAFNFGLPLLLLFSFYHKGRSNFFTASLGSIFISVLITKVFFLLGLFFGEIAGLVQGAVENLFAQSPTPATGPPLIYKSQIATVIAAIPFFAFLYGITKGKHRFTVHRHDIWFDDLPAAFDGFTIVQISDIHSGGLHNRKAVAKGIQLINDQQPDLFVFTGDLVNSKATEIEPWIDLFKTIKAPYGKYSILGNHDYGDYASWPNEAAKKANLQRLFDNHRKMDFRLLLNEHVFIEKDGEKIALIGTENWGIGFSQRGNLNKALRGIPNDMFKILLSHDPTHWEHKVKSHPIHTHLTFSGHTHGMQMGIEMFGLKWSPAKFRYPKWAGLYQENNRYLYINRGFGFLGFAGRVGIWPEVTVVRLKRRS